MNLITVFPFLLVLNYAVTESFVEFTFDAMSLGHCGLLITWKPNITTQIKEPIEGYIFTFEKYVIEEKNDENTESDDGQSHDVAINNNTNYDPYYDLQCRSNRGQYKISSLNESTLYEVIVHQYGGRSYQFLKRYDPVRMRTNLKSEEAPAKPYFEYKLEEGPSLKGQIKWYPCGKERICHNQESGTHFGVKIKLPYSTRRVNERKIEELQNDYKTIFLWPGVVYEVVVYSVNGEFETDSDSQEIFYLPSYSRVQYVNVISLPDSSVLISWKPPKHCLERVDEYIILFSNYSEPSIDVPELSVVFDEDFFSRQFIEVDSPFQQGRVLGLLPDVVYTYIILPGDLKIGLPYTMQYKLKVYNDDLPIAKPDFSYEKGSEESSNTCSLYLQWLPCGVSFDCKNTIPGSNFNFRIKTEFGREDDLKNEEKIGSSECDLHKDLVYYVRVESSIGNKTSESDTKVFKNCEEIRKNINSEL